MITGNLHIHVTNFRTLTPFVKWDCGIVGRRSSSGCSNMSGGRCVIGGGNTCNSGGPPPDDTKLVSTMDYFSAETDATASSFGSLTQVGSVKDNASGSNGAGNIGVFIGGTNYDNSVYKNSIEQVTISTLSDSTDFGDLVNDYYAAKQVCPDAAYDKLYLFGGEKSDGSISSAENEYITLTSASNATTFSIFSPEAAYGFGASNGEGRGIIGGGKNNGGSYLDNILYNNLRSQTDFNTFGGLVSTMGNAAGTANTI